MHERGAEDALAKLLAMPGGEELMITAERNIESGFWQDDILEAIGLTTRYSRRVREQTFATMYVYAKILTGEVAIIKVRAADEPDFDEYREKNAEALRDLPEPFMAELDMRQSMGDEDGFFWWTESVVGSRTCWPSDDRNEEQWVVVKPRRVPLEVGVTKPSRTLLHLRSEGGVARWPYGTDWITVFVAPHGLSDGLAVDLVRPA